MLRFLSYELSEHPLLCFGVFYILSTGLILYDITIWMLAVGVVLLLLRAPKSVGKKTIVVIVLVAIFLSLVNCERVRKDYEESQKLFFSDVGSRSELSGYIRSDPRIKHTYTEYTLGVESDYQILVQTRKYPRQKIGDKCTVKFSKSDIVELRDEYAKYLQSKSIVGVIRSDFFACERTEIEEPYIFIRAKVYEFKDSISSEVESVLLEPHASLLLGMIFGDARLFDDKVDESFRITGTTHIIAASGFNVAVLHKITEVVFGRFLPKRVRALLTLIFIWIFALAANLSGSILRATVMLSIFLLGKVFGRVYRITEALILSILLLLLITPNMIKDAGFLLSVGATLGLILFMPAFDVVTRSIMTRINIWNRALKSVSGNLFPTLSCTIGTIPVSFQFFGSASLIGIIPNLFLLQLVEFIYFLGLFTIFTHFSFGLVLSRLPFLILYHVLDIFISAIAYFSIGFSKYYDAERWSGYTYLIVITVIPILLLSSYRMKRKEGRYMGQ